MIAHEKTKSEPVRELTPLEQALAAAAADRSLVDDFYDVLLHSSVVVGTRGAQNSSEGEEDDLIVIMGDDDIPYLPVFASDAAMDVWNDADRVGRVTIPVVELISGLTRKMRVMLNPGLGITKVFDAKEIRMLRRMARRRTRSARPEETRKIQVAFKPVTRIPDGICTLVSAADSARSLLKSIFIVDVEDDHRSAGHYMLVLVDVRPADFEAAAECLVGPMAELFEEGTPVEIACLRNEAMWADLVRDHRVPPVYPRANRFLGTGGNV